MMFGQWLNICLAILTAGSFYLQQGQQGALISREAQPGEDALRGSYSIIVEGRDWGGAVTGAVLELEQEVAAVSAEEFSVMEEKQTRQNDSVDLFSSSGGFVIARTPRTVASARLCDAKGDPVEGPSRYIALELEVAPGLGSPLCLDADQQHYRWCDPYRLVIELTDGSILTAGTKTFSRLAVTRAPTGISLPQYTGFRGGSFLSGTQRLSYSAYAPQEDGGKHPLILWLHGLGEGGIHSELVPLGSSVTALAAEPIQSIMGGAHILIPQSPTMWMDDGSGYNTATGESRYTQILLELVEDYVSRHPDVDTGRIYVGGASNGGFMTVNLLLAAPGYFAAAFPICQTYRDSWLSDGDIETLSQTPIWFTHSTLDTISPYESSTAPTVLRLREAGARDVRVSEFGQIRDTGGKFFDADGQPYLYNPHFSWIPALNRLCTDETGTELFHWLAQQRLP